jgi:hypothetical protein
MMLQIDPQKVCYLIIKAREFDAKVAVVEPDPGSNPSDEGMRGVLEDYPDDPVDAEIRTLVDSLNEDEQIDLVTLVSPELSCRLIMLKKLGYEAMFLPYEPCTFFRDQFTDGRIPLATFPTA